MGFAVGWNDRPGRPWGAGRPKKRSVRGLVLGPLLARLQIAETEFPVLGFIVDAVLQTFSLLFKADVQHKFQHHELLHVHSFLK